MSNCSPAAVLLLLRVVRHAQRIQETRTLYGFVKAAWPIVEPSRPFTDGWHIRGLCEHLEAVSRRETGDTIINLPPGCMKSLLTNVFWPCWVWRRHPETRWMFASHALELTMRDARLRRALITSDWYARDWPYKFVYGENKQKRSTNTARGWMLSTSVSGPGTGEHPDFVVVDDPHTAEQAESFTERATVHRWWENTIQARGVIRDVRRVVVMQRLHRQDLCGHLLSKGGFTHICLPMEYEGPDRMPPTPLGWKDPRTFDGELLWPESFPQQVVDKSKRDYTPPRWAGQYQQRPPEQDIGAEFPADYFGDQIWFDDWPSLDKQVLRVIALDPSTGQGEHCDYSAFVLAVLDDEGRTWIEADLARRDPMQLVSRAVELTRRFEPAALGVESNGFQMLLRDLLMPAFDQAGLRVEFDAMLVTANKLLRIRRLSPYLARDQLRFRNTDGTKLLVEQLRAFPTAPYDDGPDALEQALSMIAQYGTGQTEVEYDRAWARD